MFEELDIECPICGSRLLLCIDCFHYGLKHLREAPAVFCPKCDGKCPVCGKEYRPKKYIHVEEIEE